jgi:hypothetical protein
MEKKRDVFIKIEKSDKISQLLGSLKKKRELLKNLFKEYDILMIKENKMYDDLRDKIEDVQNSLNRVNL